MYKISKFDKKQLEITWEGKSTGVYTVRLEGDFS